YVLRSVDMEREELELTGPNRRVLLDLQGRVKSAEPLLLSWDRYRDDGPPQVSWNANGQSHTHHVLKGRVTNSVAMTPAGDLVAISVGTGLNIGRIRDSIYVLRTADETEVFRRYLPMYTRTPIFFPTDNLMVYTADGQVIVLRIAR